MDFNINSYERKIYSQNGEDGILQYIFEKIEITNKFFVEFGIQDATECNTRFLREQGWTGLWLDSDYESDLIKKEFVTAENIESLFRKYNVPKSFDLLSIDIDSNDYWVWNKIDDYFPNVVVIEYNSSFAPTESKVIPYDPFGRWDGTNYFGASLLALKKLGDSKGYELIGCDSNGVNAFFCRKEKIKDIFPKKTIEELYRPPKYGVKVNGEYIGHPPSDREMMTI